MPHPESDPGRDREPAQVVEADAPDRAERRTFDPLDLLRAPDRRWNDRLAQVTGGWRVRPWWFVVVIAVLAGAFVVVRATATEPDEPLPMTTPRRPGTTAGTAPASVGSAGGGATTPTSKTRGGSAPVTVWVNVAGAVVRPGLFAIREEARLAELINLAGGLTPDADPDRVNLAAKVRDGDRVYVPRRFDVGAPSIVAGGNGGSAGPDGGSGGAIAPGSGARPGAVTTMVEVIDLNAATVEQLDTLPGVGPATAAAIIDYRRERGPFRTVDDLVKVRGLGTAKVEQLRKRVKVG